MNLKEAIDEYIVMKREAVKTALEADKNDERWIRLSDALDAAGSVLKEPADTYMIASVFLTLGARSEEVMHPKYEDTIDAFKALHANTFRELPFQMHNLKKKVLKEIAQGMALYLWSDDLGQNIRLSDMCEKVYRMLAPLAQDKGVFELMPGEPEGLKPWLRPVAPDYAKRAGRPRK